MKTLKLFFILLSLTGLLGFKKSDPVIKANLNVERYIELLKSNQYDALNLPEFTYQDIPALLKFRNETQIITNFPRNGISSFYQRECKLGMYVLWTVESIRAVAIKSDYLVERFPSQNPILEKRDYSELFTDSKESHEIAAKAYFEWWENNKRKKFDAFKNIDPLKNTVYKWH